jgi:hypothetical protein
MEAINGKENERHISFVLRRYQVIAQTSTTNSLTPVDAYSTIPHQPQGQG